MAFSSGVQVFRTSRSVPAGRNEQHVKTARARRSLSSDSGAAAERGRARARTAERGMWAVKQGEDDWRGGAG